jgi:hypothetical protein
MDGKQRGEALAVLEQLGIEPTERAISLTPTWIHVLREALMLLGRD